MAVEAVFRRLLHPWAMRMPTILASFLKNVTEFLLLRRKKHSYRYIAEILGKMFDIFLSVCFFFSTFAKSICKESNICYNQCQCNSFKLTTPYHVSIFPIAQDKNPQRSPLRLRFLPSNLRKISYVNGVVIQRPLHQRRVYTISVGILMSEWRNNEIFF